MRRLMFLTSIRNASWKSATGGVLHQSRQASHFSYDDTDNEVLVEGRINSRAAVLNRPSVLNALNTEMGARLGRLYESWEDNPDVGFSIMKGNGRAFCSGGDVVSLYKFLHDGKVEECKKFFGTLYKFIYLLGTYLKPNVAVLDGLTMGGGAGISLPGMFRVATDRTVFSVPECRIGFHPDAGASYYLPRLPGYLGEYLALTGDRLNGVEMIACGLATHYSLSSRLPLLDERLAKLTTDDPSVIDNSLSQYGDLVYPDGGSILHRIEAIDKCFCGETIEEVMELLEREAAASVGEASGWCHAALERMREASPLSLKVSLKSLRVGRFQSLDQCLSREYRLSINFISRTISNDFSEGVRARLIAKDFSPQWDLRSVGQVTEDMVDAHFLPIDGLEPDIDLPVSTREPYSF